MNGLGDEEASDRPSASLNASEKRSDEGLATGNE